jgi:hypothetical protein
MSSAVPRAPRSGLFRVIDWRLVAATGLPIWTFVFGLVAAHRPAPPAPAPAVETAAVTPAPVEPIPLPREVVIRTEYRPVPVVIPAEPAPVSAPVVPVAAVAPEPAAPAEFKLPASELMPEDRCQTFETKIRFHGDLAAAAAEARASKKMLLVLHLSGNFDDPGFT